MTIESLAWFLIVVAIFGLIVGAIARLLIPGPTPLGVVGTMGAGVAGGLIGGFVGRLLLGPNLTQGWIWVLSILGAILVVAFVTRRGRAYAGPSPRRRLMWERPHDRQAVVDRPYRSGHGGWSRRGLLPGRGYDDRGDVAGIRGPHRPAGRRRRWLF